MLFQATPDQVLQIAVNAVNASKPMGMGFLQFQEVEYKPEDLLPYLNDKGVYVDYFEGRMVKLWIWSVSQDLWEIPDNPTADYQSWVRVYPTSEELINSVLQA